MASKSESVRVCVRIRPLSTKEVQDGRAYIVHANPAQGEISLSNPEADAREPPKKFTFDAAIPPEKSQQDVYAQAATDIVESVVNGFNGTIFAYGQTGAGKSHTMEGYSEPPEAKGIIPNSFSHIFDRIAAEADNKQFMVYASYLEIYNEEIRDLLAPDPKNRLELKETVDAGVFVKDLTSRQVAAAAEIDAVMQQGKKNRSVGATLMNQTSSRSHSMFTITVEACSTAVSEANGKPHICVGKLNLVDLAGSERQAKTGATGDRMKEATKINLSLSALGNVISALVDGKSQHIPYRDSKLTRLLQDSLGGNAKTVMIANCGPADYNYNETLSTLRYANRAKNIKNKPKINEDPKDAKIREYQEKIKELREALAAQEKNGPAAPGAEGKAFSKDGGGSAAPGPHIVERIVEKTVVKREGVSEEVLRKLEEDARREKRELKQKAQEEMKALLAAQSRTEEERDQLERQLQSQAQQKKAMAKEKDEMVSQLEALEHKLISGGRVLDKAAKQERQLREAQARVEAQKRQELQLAQELAEKEDSNMLLEEQYTTLQEAVDDKTRKLKKLWAKHKAATTEIEDLKAEFQAEKEDMLDTVRELTRQLKLKHLLLSHFVPLDEAQSLEKRARYDADHDAWQVSRLETKPSSLRPKRPISRRGARRIESEYARRNRLIDPLNVRWRSDNVVQLDLEMPERRTRDFEAANGSGYALSMNYWLERVGVPTEEGVEISFANEVEVAPSGLASSKEKAQPTSSGSSKEIKEGTKKSSSSSSADDKSRKSASKRPPTASRRRREQMDE
ncbi:Kinesin-like protein kif3a [Phytophthora pseudosyringae]|uniref:Kinesin-like protein n=1 Tax=Phytophthora pseudosyringae TaxID=221518 RepID=A0A8T1VWI0_9STRA|nr:Kinesin-like protein kif3a [Phytophthora pseudosyringae]